MNNRKASFDEYNATCDSTIGGDDLNRAIIMSFSDTLSSTQNNFTRDSLSTTLTVNYSSKVDSTVDEKTFTLPVKQCPPKIVGEEILIDPYVIPRKETFVSRIPKYSDGKLKQPIGLNDDKKSNAVETTKNLYDVENIKQSNLWPALTALETSLHSSDEQISTDDTDILKKLDEEFSCSPRQFTATLMTIIEESFGEWVEGNGDESRFGLIELLKTTARSGKRLEDESPPECMSSCFGRSKETDNEGKNNSAEPDCDDESIQRFISLPSESQALADESPQSSYASFEALRMTTGVGRFSTKESKKYVNTAKITVNSGTPTNSTNWAATCSRNRTPVKRMSRSPVSRPKINAVSFEGIADESTESCSSLETLTVTTATGKISTTESKKYVKTPRITVNSGTSTNSTNRTANCRRNRTPVKRMSRSPVSRPKIRAVSFAGIADESPESYSSLETLTVTTGAQRISTKESKKYPEAPRITVDSGTPTNSTKQTANCRRNRTPVRTMPRSPISRPKINAVSFEGISDETRQSSYLSLETLRITTGTGKMSIKEPKKYIKTPRITVDPGTPSKSTNREANCRRNRTPVNRMPRSPIRRSKINAVSFAGIDDHRSESSILSPLSNKDDDEYLTAESETEEASDVSEKAKTNGSPKKKLDMSNIASHHRKWVTTFEQHSKYTCDTSLRTVERKRKLSSHTDKLEMRWLKKLTEKRQKCFDLVNEMLEKSVSEPSEPEVKSPCLCSPCKLSKEFCSILSAFQEYMQFAMHAPEITKKNDNHRFVTSVKMNLKTKNSKSPSGVRKSMSKKRKSLNKAQSPRFLSSHVKLNPSPRNRGVSPKKMTETRVDTSSIRTVSQLRRVFSPKPGTAGCSESKNLGAKQTIPRKILSSVGTGRNGHIIFLPGHGPSYYKKVVSPVGEYIRGKKAA